MFAVGGRVPGSDLFDASWTCAALQPQLGPVDAKSRTIKNHGQKFTLRLLKELARRGHVTVMCHCPEDSQTCHRHELKRMILSS